MKVSREFKVNVTAWGFFTLSVLVVVIVVMAIWKGRTSSRPAPLPAGSAPAPLGAGQVPERVEH